MDLLRIFIEALKTLNVSHLINLKEIIFKDDKSMTNEDFIGLIKKYHLEHKACCPLCKSIHIIKNGFTKKGSQRYKCKICKRTFSTFTDTPFSYTKKSLELWGEYIMLMSRAASIRACGHKLGINIATAFQWRHKILKALLAMLKDQLGGIIEIDEVFIAESFKGNHSKSMIFEMNRPSRERGMTLGEYLQSRKVSVLCCRDRKDSLFARAADRCKARYDRVFALLGNKLPKGSTLCTNNNMAYIPLSKRLNCKLYKMRGSFEIKEKKYHIQNVSIFGQEIKNKIENHFKGVATRYLNHYLVWIHWMVKLRDKFTAYNFTDMLAMISLSGERLRIEDFKYVESLPA
ncbi:IS1595 family transposase [Clostridium thermarum]|uniref:IS1595 family transposase n=1 Tax=Clostridium thermarum TaxID=1716543 RepID=UPI0013D5557A|nr:IS1595 family transposase [Clostridium thermarum]